MTSGKTRRALPLIAALLLPATTWCGVPELDTLLRSFAQESPASTQFVEVRFSHLLARPLVVSGTLEHPDGQSFVRVVRHPFRERTEIRGDTVTIAREGQRTRSVSLQRVPELRTLLGSFGGLLTGDRVALEREFILDLHGSESSWMLVLEPRDPRVAARVHDVTVLGHGPRPKCIRTNEPDGDASVVALDVSGQDMPQPLELGRLDDWCRATER